MVEGKRIFGRWKVLGKKKFYEDFKFFVFVRNFYWNVNYLFVFEE